MLCAISGEAAEVPVVSSKSGKIYEKRLIEQYLSENGTEPETGEALTVEDLIDIKTSRIVRPRPPALTSIPSLLQAFQNEWDSLTLETHKLRHELQQAYQQLSTALYENDAAMRVIAKIQKERDDARNALSRVSINAHTGSNNGDAMQVDSAALPSSIVAKVDATQERLSKTRRKRPVPTDWATTDDISSFTVRTESVPLYPGGDVLALNPAGDLAVIGGTDGVAGVYSLPQQKVLQALKGGGGSITDAIWAGSKAVISTSAGQVKVFNGNSEAASLGAHAGEIAAVALHPSGDILASAGVDKSYVLYDLEDSAVLTQVYSDAALTCIQFHPDGHLLAAGGIDGEIKVFDVKSGTMATSFDLGAPLKTIRFSENGTWLAATTVESSNVSIWDLRKMSQVNSLEIGSAISSISWDYSGQFLVVGAADGISVQQYSKASKQWSEPLKLAVAGKSVAWGSSARSILALSKDGTLTTLAAQA